MKVNKSAIRVDQPSNCSSSLNPNTQDNPKFTQINSTKQNQINLGEFESLVESDQIEHNPVRLNRSTKKSRTAIRSVLATNGILQNIEEDQNQESLK